MAKQLIYDVGAHRGDDSFVYLELGYRVVAIEANPVLAKEMESRFRKELSSGDLTIVNCLVSEQDDCPIAFYLAEDSSKSSVRNTGHSSLISVNSRRLGSLIAGYGNPWYCKIDIEDSDLQALKSFDHDLPFYLSVEVSGKSVKELSTNPQSLSETLDYLHTLGYQQFKLVDQESLSVLGSASFYRQMRTLAGRVRRRLQMASGSFPRNVFCRRFKLPKTAELSGFLSYQLPGPWKGYEETKDLLLFHYCEYASICTDPSFIFWVDIHAALSPYDSPQR